MIDKEQFLKIIDATPLVSIDLIIENKQGEVLLGKRVNRPAQGYWFVPGGRITKNEKIADAIKRISKAELGITFSANDTKLLGAFDHMYGDNYFGKDGISTHYVVLAYQAILDNESDIVPDSQHSEFKWWPIDDLLENSDVHQNTKTYFKNIK